MRIAHIITRMIVGGAQENTLLNCLDLIQIHGDNVLLITGPAIGPEGDLLRQGRGGDAQPAVSNTVPLAYVPALRRSIHPWRVHPRCGECLAASATPSCSQHRSLVCAGRSGS